MKQKYSGVIVALIVLLLTSCKKSEFLDKKPDAALVVPTTLDELQSILDNSAVMTGASIAFGGLDPIMTEAAADDIYLIDSRRITLLNSNPESWNLHIWNDDIYVPNNYDILSNWTSPYRAVYYANVALEGLDKLEPSASEMEKFNNVKGSALFYRSRMFYQLLQVFAPVYDKTTASTDWGIPLRLSSDANEKITRSTVAACYEKIIRDLRQAEPLLPAHPLYNTRPGKPALYALLSKTWLVMQEYDSALVYANKCLELHHSLLDFNNLNISASNPFPTKVLTNKEIIFHSVMLLNIAVSLSSIDTTLYRSYQTGDLRKTAFFTDQGVQVRYKAGYGSRHFSGIATGEILLIRAECKARKGLTTDAMNDLNELLRNRWDKNVFVPLTASNSPDALDKILMERRKELVLRGIRWSDLRRLNKEGRNITITRKVDNQLINLPPNDLRYTFLIPPDVIGFHPDMPQNPR